MHCCSVVLTNHTMILEQLHHNLVASLHCHHPIQINNNEEMIIPELIARDGVDCFVCLTSNQCCIFKIQVVLYEHSAFALTLLSFCKEIGADFLDIEFQDDPLSKSIIAIQKHLIKNEELFLERANSLFLGFAYTVKHIRNSIANVALKISSPLFVHSPERSLFYLSLMQPSIEHIYQKIELPIDWNDILTLWKNSHSVVFVPQIQCDSSNGLIDNISDVIKPYSDNSESKMCLSYFGLPIREDSNDLQTIFDIRERLLCNFGYSSFLFGYNYGVNSTPYTAQIAILYS